MPGKTGIKVDTQDWLRQTREFAKRYGLTAGDVLRYETGLWANDLGRKPFPGAKKSLFQRSIDNDIKRAFQVVDGRVKAESINAETHFAGARDQRTGRVRKSYGRGGSELRPVISNRDARTLLRAHVAHIGRMQAGWNPMIGQFRGGPAQAWVARHSGRGTAASFIKPDGSGYGIGVNRVPYAGRFYTPARMTFSARLRERHLRKLLKMRTDKVIDLFNRMRAKGRL